MEIGDLEKRSSPDPGKQENIEDCKFCGSRKEFQEEGGGGRRRSLSAGNRRQHLICAKFREKELGGGDSHFG